MDIKINKKKKKFIVIVIFLTIIFHQFVHNYKK
jgi:hypothetical protein